MPINIIYGPIKSGKTAKCTEILKKAVNQAYYIVPEPLSYSAEISIANMFGAVSSEITEVTSFKRLYHKVIGSFGGGNYDKLTKGGKQLLLGLCCKRSEGKLSTLKKAAMYPGFPAVLEGIIREFVTYGVTPEKLLEAAEKSDDEAFKNKLVDLHTLYSDFAVLTKGKYITSDDELTILSKIILDNRDTFAEKIFIFDGFISFTPQEMQVIKNLYSCGSEIYIAFSGNDTEGGKYDLYADQKSDIEQISEFAEINYITTSKIYAKSPFVQISKHFEKRRTRRTPCDSIYITEYNTAYDEITGVAEEITRLVRSGARYRDISVSVRDSERYGSVVSEIFRKYDIPCFVSRKINASTQPAVDALFGALEAVLENFSYKSVFSYLKSGFAAENTDETDLLENYVLATSIAGSGYKKEWKYTPKISHDFEIEEKFLVQVNKIKDKLVSPLIHLSDGLASGNTLKEKAAALFEFMTEIKLFENTKSGVDRFREINPQVSSYYGQIWNIIVNALDEMVELAGDETLSTAEFVQIFKSSVTTHEIGTIPTSVDSVSICGVNDVTSPEYLFIVGMNDGVYPQVMTDEGILSDTERQTLSDFGIKLAADTVKRIFSEDFLICNLLMRPKEKLYISYPISDISGAAFRASRIVIRLCSLFTDLKVVSRVAETGISKENILSARPAFSYMTQAMRDRADGLKTDAIWQEVEQFFREEEPEKYGLIKDAMNFSPGKSSLSRDVLDKFFRDGEIKVSVSRLEQFKKCPFAHFLKYMMYADKRKISGLENTDTGSFMHEIMERLSKIIETNSLTWHTASEDFLTRTATKLIDEKIIELEAMFDTKSQKRAHMLMRLKNMLLISVIYVAKHLRAGKFEPIGYEIDISGKDGKYIPLTINAGDKKITLCGVIDRADIYTDEDGGRFVRIIDYKSGSRDFDVGKLYYGLSLQLAVYLDRMCELENAEPAGILYFRFRDPAIDRPEDESEIESKLADEFKMTGLVARDAKIVEAMDENAGSKSSIIPVSFLQNGEIKKTQKVATFPEFSGIRKQTKKLLKSISLEILSGKTDVSPVYYDKETGCDFCTFKEACHFEQKLGCSFNYIPKQKHNEIMEILTKEAEPDAEIYQTAKTCNI